MATAFKMLLGPVLSYRGLTDRGQAHLIQVMIATTFTDAEPNLISSALQADFSPFAHLPLHQPRIVLWRALLKISVQQSQTQYRIEHVSGLHGHSERLTDDMTVFSPTVDQPVRMAYGSCNGFSDPKLMKEVKRPYERWQHLAVTHAQMPYHYLLMGGDQIYSDAMWEILPSLKAWTQLGMKERLKASFTVEMRQQCERFFLEAYLKQWGRADVASVLARIPTIMMWDDHDIFDGWGSHPADLHGCAVYQGIFTVARQYFHWFQQQLSHEGDSRELHPAAMMSSANATKLSSALSLGFMPTAEVAVAVLDLRSERQPAPNQIASLEAWNHFFDWLEQLKSLPPKHLIVMSSIPLAYLDLNGLERALKVLPGQQELEDDLRDHWRSKLHQQERVRLVHRLLDFASRAQTRVTVISGDVHLGALAVIESTRHASPTRSNVINQLVSSALVHPAPAAIVRWALSQFCDRDEIIDSGIQSTMMAVDDSGHKLIGERNWLALECDAQQRIWAKWHVEGSDEPTCKVIHPCR